jgi:hypothetical protein
MVISSILPDIRLFSVSSIRLDTGYQKRPDIRCIPNKGSRSTGATTMFTLLDVGWIRKSIFFFRKIRNNYEIKIYFAKFQAF